MFEDFIPIFAIAVTCGLPLVALMIFIVLNYRKRVRLMELHHAERMAAIERGMDLPPLPFDQIEGHSPRRRRTSLLPGLVWSFVGLALLIGLGQVSDQALVVGLLPLGVGLAYLIYYFVEGRKIEARQIDHDLAPRVKEGS
jgi:hypothetical protein